jgi:hypothetical protein
MVNDKLQEGIEFSTILVELDALLDTRISTISTFGEDAFLSNIMGDYYQRGIDVFKDVDMDEYRLRYEKRDTRTLFKSMMTPIGKLIKEYVVTVLENNLSTPDHRKPKVVVNVYPYKLSEYEIRTVIGAVRSLTKDMADIEVIDMSYDQLTSGYVKTRLAAMVLYHYDLWLEAQSVNKNFEKVGCPEVTLFAPRISFNEEVTPRSDNKDPFEEMKLLASLFIGIIFLPIDNFCLMLKPEDLKKMADKTKVSNSQTAE